MTSGITDALEFAKSSKIIQDLYLALFTQNALRNVNMSLAITYMDADIKGTSIQWEETSACPLLKVVNELQGVQYEQFVKDPATLHAYSRFVQSKVLTFIASDLGPKQPNTVMLSQILVKCQEFATNNCHPLVSVNHLGTGNALLLSELVASTCASTDSDKLRSVRVQLAVIRAFTATATELFAAQAREWHRNVNDAGPSYFESFKEFAPLLYVARAITELVTDKEITTSADLHSYLAQIRQQFTATDELSSQAQQICNELLERCLFEARNAGTRIWEEQTTAA